MTTTNNNWGRCLVRWPAWSERMFTKRTTICDAAAFSQWTRKWKRVSGTHPKRHILHSCGFSIFIDWLASQLASTQSLVVTFFPLGRSLKHTHRRARARAHTDTHNVLRIQFFSCGFLSLFVHPSLSLSLSLSISLSRSRKLIKFVKGLLVPLSGF